MNEPIAWRIRDALPADLDLVVEYNLRLAFESESKALDRQALLRGVARLLQDPVKGRYFLACDGERPVGQLMLTTEWSDWRDGWFWWIQSVYVEKEFRRRGVYRALHEHVMREAAGRGDVVGLRLYVDEQNHTGQATYRCMGMSPAGYFVLEQMVRT
ncbi:MAG: GNAT family N-acetyltransferase [Planctomycetia bacterium]|nr:GNAT family N-acetyltransferase [Planctomycetia bacterium]